MGPIHCPKFLLTGKFVSSSSRSVILGSLTYNALQISQSSYIRAVRRRRCVGGGAPPVQKSRRRRRRGVGGQKQLFLRSTKKFRSILKIFLGTFFSHQSFEVCR